MFCGSGSASRLAKAAGAGPSRGMRGVKLHAPLAQSKFPSQTVKNHLRLGALLERITIWTRLRREADFQAKMLKTHHVEETFGPSSIVLLGRCNGFCSLSKVSQTCAFCSSFKNYGRRGFGEDLQRCISRGRSGTRDMSIRHVRRLGRRFLQRGCVLGHQIIRFAKMILRDRCSTLYDLASLFRGRRNT